MHADNLCNHDFWVLFYDLDDKEGNTPLPLVHVVMCAVSRECHEEDLKSLRIMYRTALITPLNMYMLSTTSKWKKKVPLWSSN